jgi:hypothetical protein
MALPPRTQGKVKQVGSRITFTIEIMPASWLS